MPALPGRHGPRSAAPEATRLPAEGEERITHPHEDTGAGLVLDFLFVRGIDVAEAVVGPSEVFLGLSDYLPVWAVLRFR